MKQFIPNNKRIKHPAHKLFQMKNEK